VRRRGNVIGYLQVHWGFLAGWTIGANRRSASAAACSPQEGLTTPPFSRSPTGLLLFYGGFSIADCGETCASGPLTSVGL
jgi:hypothetical protein